MTTSNHRISEHPIDPLFLDRWSPRAFSDEAISEAEILTMLEAAHWAPSASNNQPWRFVYALRGSEQFKLLLSLLIDFNQSWAKNAAALVFIISRTDSTPLDAAEQKPIYSHSFDAGAAWGSLALQAHISGWHAHGMTGVHFNNVNPALGIPDGFRFEAAVAIGKIGDKEQLPDSLRARETPSPRKPLSDVAFHGVFVAK